MSRQVHLLHEISLSQTEENLKQEIRTTLENDPFYVEIRKKLQKNSKESQQEGYLIDKKGYLW